MTTKGVTAQGTGPTKKPKRTARGTFAPGESGNPDGRPRTTLEDLVRADKLLKVLETIALDKNAKAMDRTIAADKALPYLAPKIRAPLEVDATIRDTRPLSELATALAARLAEAEAEEAAEGDDTEGA